MKKLFAILFIALTYTRSLASNILQVTASSDETPPTPDEGTITPFGGPGVPGSTPINFIVPFLIISAIFLSIYIIKKNRIKSV